MSLLKQLGAGTEKFPTVSHGCFAAYGLAFLLSFLSRQLSRQKRREYAYGKER